MHANETSHMAGQNRRTLKPRLSLKDRRSFSSDMSIDISSTKSNNIFGNNTISTPNQIEEMNNKATPLLSNTSQTDVIMESEEEQCDLFVPPLIKPPSNFGSPKRINYMRDSMNNLILNAEMDNMSPSTHSIESLGSPANQTAESSNNTTPIAMKFRFGNHSRSNSGNSHYQLNLENHKQYTDMKNVQNIIARTTSSNSSFDISNGQKTKHNGVKHTYSTSSSGVIGYSPLHKHSSSSGLEKSKFNRKHRHNLSLPQAHMMSIPTSNSGNDKVNRFFGENFFKINVQYQETLSPLLDSVDSEDLKKMNTLKRFHENQHKGDNDICTKSFEIYDADSKVTFFQKHYTLFKEKALRRCQNGAIPLLPSWLNDLLTKRDKLYFLKKFQRLSFLERERIDQYFLYQKNLYECSNVALKKTTSEDSANSELFSGDVFENGIKNRYKSVIPYQRTRVILHENAKSMSSFNKNALENTDTYFNGNYLTVPFKTTYQSGPYIATQAPLEHTIRDFFNVLISDNVRMVLTLTKEIENGMNKCSSFWKDNMEYNGIHCDLLDEFKMNDEHMRECVFKDKVASESKTTRKTDGYKETKDIQSYFQVPLSNITCDIEDSLIVRLLKLSWLDVVTGEPKEWVFLQIQMTSWPDFSVPSCNCDLLNVLNMKTIVQKLTADVGNNLTEGKVLVHCSSGSGRSGAICCADTLIGMLQNNDTCFTSEDPIYEIVASFREQRLHMVQNVNQYLLIYDTLVSFLQSKLDNSWDDFEKKCMDLDVFKRFKTLIH
ncbi:hypothetical protein QEN19_001317 [Hanseniaspora menglaensis]